MNINNWKNRATSLTVACIILVSCAYDEADNLLMDGKGPNILRVDAGPDKLVVSPTVTSTVKLADVWRDANSEASLNQNVSASFATDAAIVTAYNAANDGIDYEPLPTNFFSFSPASLQLNSGEFRGELSLTLNAVGLDLAKDYAIGIVTTAEGWVAGGDKFIKVALPSAYEGEYVSTGTRYNYNVAGDANVSTWPPTGWVSLANWSFDPTTANTLSSKTVAVHAANNNGGFGRINLTVTDTPHDKDGDGTPESFVVSIVPNSDIGLNALVKSTHRQSFYTPGTKTFELYYEYTNINGTYRNLYHKLVKK